MLRANHLSPKTKLSNAQYKPVIGPATGQQFTTYVLQLLFPAQFLTILQCHRQKLPEVGNTLEAEDEQNISSSSEEEGDEFVSTQR